MSINLWMAALTLASMHIILSLAFTLTYSTIDAPNYSIGPLMTIGAYQSFILSRIMNIPVYLSLPIALVIGFLLNSGIFLLVIKPLTDRQRSKVLITLSTLGLSLVITGVFVIFVYWLRDFSTLYTFTFLLKGKDFSVGSIPGVFIISSLSAFLVYFGWRHFYWRTQAGIAYRAILENPQLAKVQGVNIERTWLFVWGLSGSLACFAGAVIPLWFSVTTSAGVMMMTPIIAASILGGLKNPKGFFIGGLFTGVSEIMLTTLGQELLGVWVGEYRPIIPMVILVLVLRFKPQGLLGRKNIT